MSIQSKNVITSGTVILVVQELIPQKRLTKVLKLRVV